MLLFTTYLPLFLDVVTESDNFVFIYYINKSNIFFFHISRNTTWKKSQKPTFIVDSYII